MQDIIVIAHNLRSTHNVGSLLRTAEGLGVEHVYLTGYTPFPKLDTDPRLPHESAKIHKQIEKTALGAETTQAWSHELDIFTVITQLKASGYTIAALEQSKSSVALPDYKPAEKLAIILGREVEGMEAEVITICDVVLEIPMKGQKESFNVVQAAAMALYHCTFYSTSANRL